MTNWILAATILLSVSLPISKGNAGVRFMSVLERELKQLNDRQYNCTFTKTVLRRPAENHEIYKEDHVCVKGTVRLTVSAEFNHIISSGRCAPGPQLTKCNGISNVDSSGCLIPRNRRDEILGNERTVEQQGDAGERLF